MQSTSSIKQTLAAPANTKLVIALLKADPAPSRNGLAKELCRRLELRDPKGDWQIATTSKALADEGTLGSYLNIKHLRLTEWA